MLLGPLGIPGFLTASYLLDRVGRKPDDVQDVKLAIYDDKLTAAAEEVVNLYREAY